MTPKKASDTELIEAYNLDNNVWRVAKLFNMCGQSVWERLTRLKVIKKRSGMLTNKEKKLIIKTYSSGIKRGDGKLKKLSLKINRRITTISRFAGTLGLTDPKRINIDGFGDMVSERTKIYFMNNPHPKGMLGKKHTQKTIESLKIISKANYKKLSEESKKNKIKKMLLTKSKINSPVPLSYNVSWKSGKRNINGIVYFFRSSWESNYARYLDYLKINNKILSWQYEPDRFYIHTINKVYIPDFNQ